jgi:hypothetical protein
MPLLHALKHIRLNLARPKEFPSDSTQRSYEFVTPLDQPGISMRCRGASIAITAECAGSGPAATTR